MFEKCCVLFLLSTVLIFKKIHTEWSTNGKKSFENAEVVIQPNTLELSSSTQYILTLSSYMSKKQGPVCREKLVLLYLCILLLQESYAPEPNPGPRPPKYPCGVCKKAVKWTTPGVQCDSCKLWYHQNCMGMCDQVYQSLRNVSWECVQCGVPNFSSCLFDLTFYESLNTFDSLGTDSSIHCDQDISFNNPRATSSPNREYNHTNSRLPSSSSIPCTTINEDVNITHPSLSSSNPEVPCFIQISKQKRNDIPLKVLTVNCQSISNKKASFEVLCESVAADIVIGTESWLSPSHQSSEFFPDNYSVYRKDRSNKKGGGVFLLVNKSLHSVQPDELILDSDCEMLWAQISVRGATSLYVGAFYRPPSADSPDYLADLDTCLSRIPEGAHVWLGGDFNLGGIDWPSYSLKPDAVKPTLCRQLIDIANNRFLEQQVKDQTRTSVNSSNMLDLFFCNNSSLISSTEVIPGISDHDVIYVEASLRPQVTPSLKRSVYCFGRANKEGLREDLHKLYFDLSALKPTSNTNTLWSTFRDTVSHLMSKHIPTKIIKESHKTKPWIDKNIKSKIKKKAKLYSKMKKSGKPIDISKYKTYKQQTQRIIRQAYHKYINNLIEPTESESPTKQKKFWNFIKSLKKDNSGISALKDKGKLFNSARDKANILNRQYTSVFTHESPGEVPTPPGTPYPTMDEIEVNEEGILKLLKNINPKKATGPDQIPARILKDFATEIAPILTIIFSKSLEEGAVPDDWRHANVTAVYKKGSRQDPANYRPVSLTSLCGKLLEHVVVSHTMRHLDRQNILHDCQHGFRARRSCETQLLTLAHELAASLDRRVQTDMVILDFSKAFDRVPHRRLLRKVHHYGIRGHALEWISSFLHDRTQKVVATTTLAV